MKKLRINAFTLVELVITIVILAILGTIAFISMQSYSTSARDSTRITDLSSMKTTLELFHLDAGKYPETTSGFVVTYSGSEVWTQGIFGESTMSNVEKLDRIPKDPLTDKEYTYSTIMTKQEYQLAGIMEGDLAYIPHPNPLPRVEGIAVLVNQTNAGEVVATAIVTGNYNGQTLKTESGVICEILSLPSIVSSEESTDLETILNNRSLVYNGYNNLPSNYKSSKYKINEGFDFESEKLVVYSDNQECKPLYDAENATARINFVKNLQTAYSGTLIENADNIVGIVALDTNNLQSVTYFSATYVNNNLGGNLTSYATSSSVICDAGQYSEDGLTCVPDLAYTVSGSFGINASGATINVCGTNVIADASGNFSTTRNSGDICNSIVATRAGYTCSTTINGPASLTNDIINIAGTCTITNIYAGCTAPTQIKTATTTYGSCDTPDIIVCGGSGTGYTLAGCNLGTTSAGTGSSSYGTYFQWGNNFGNGTSGLSLSTTRVNASGYGPGNYYSRSIFVNSSSGDWALYNSQNDNLWGGVSNTNIDRQGPCLTGYHIPKLAEWSNVVSFGGWGNGGTAMMNALNLPIAGHLNRSSGDYSSLDGYYWTSDYFGIDTARCLNFRSNIINVTNSTYGSRGNGFTIRCFKN